MAALALGPLLYRELLEMELPRGDGDVSIHLMISTPSAVCLRARSWGGCRWTSDRFPFLFFIAVLRLDLGREEEKLFTFVFHWGSWTGCGHTGCRVVHTSKLFSIEC